MANVNKQLATKDLSEGSNRLLQENPLFFACQEYQKLPEPESFRTETQNIMPAQQNFTKMHGVDCAYENEMLNYHYTSYKPIIFINQ